MSVNGGEHHKSQGEGGARIGSEAVDIVGGADCVSVETHG